MDTIKYRKGVIDELSRTFMKVDEKDVNDIVDMILNANKLYVTGAGRAGLSMRGFGMRLMHAGVKPSYVVGEIATPSIQEGDILFVGSGRASTKTSVTYAKQAKAMDAKVVLFTANLEGGDIGPIADKVLYLEAPIVRDEADPDIRSIQPMGNRFEQSLLLVTDLIVKVLIERVDLDMDVMYHNHTNLE